jgi:hypothetical protein
MDTNYIHLYFKTPYLLPWSFLKSESIILLTCVQEPIWICLQMKVSLLMSLLSDFSKGQTC